MARNEKTSKPIGTLASKLALKSKSKPVRQVAASALTQRPDHKKGGKKK